MNDENDKPKNQPEDDWVMTDPNLKIQQNQPPSSDFDKTAPNPAVSPSQPSDDWEMATPNVNVPTEEKQDDWEMPKPVFRVSDGIKPVPATPQNQPDAFEKSSPDTDFSSGKSDVAGDTPPNFNLDENRPSAAAPPRKRSKLPLVFGGIFLMFFLGTTFLFGIYFLFLNKTETAAIFKKSPERSENTSSNSNSLKTSAPPLSSDSPKEIEYKSAMVLIPAGEFTMGSDSGEDVSKPAHKIPVPAFYIDKYEVTNAQFKEFCEATDKAAPSDPDFEKGYFLNRPSAPVMGISFDDAKAYAEWIGKRLPTEEEWEKAASWNADTQTKLEFPWGNEFDAAKSAFNLAAPSDVGKYPGDVSPFGVMDMAGNVAEWVDSFFKPYPNSKATSKGFDEKNRVVRGGYFGSEVSSYLKTTTRIYVPPNFVTTEAKTSYLGFRCAISADDARLKTQSK